jgi:hypothetical protein
MCIHPQLAKEPPKRLAVAVVRPVEASVPGLAGVVGPQYELVFTNVLPYCRYPCLSTTYTHRLAHKRESLVTITLQF